MRTVIVYSGEGASNECVEQARNNIIGIMRGSSVITIDAKTLINGGWQEKTSLFIMPGGRDLFYHRDLSPYGTRLVRDFVEGGGTYLGLCAGAYFASAYIEFELGGELEVCGKRDLAFFSGKAIGPAYGLGQFRYENEGGARAARILWKDCSRNLAYFNGGCFFELSENHQNVDVLARYDDLPGQPAAIIACKIGKGKAILSGVHLEFSPREFALNSAKSRQIYADLLKGDALRIEAFKKMLMTKPQN